MRSDPLQDLLGRPLAAAEEENAPARLSTAGDEELFRRGVRVAVIGSRAASAGGLRRARRLVAQGATVVSGLARGVDAAAHRAAIAAGGRTLAVLGTGLDRVYPAEHAGLQEEIGRHHLVVTEFPPGTPPRPGNSPWRNRTMALLSHATVIVEAAARSGTRHQAHEALRLGRRLFLMRSLVAGGAVHWAGELLEAGGQVLVRIEDLLERLQRAPSPANAQTRPLS